MVAYCSYSREDRGIHTPRGSHSSSHDSRRRYLKKEHKSITQGSNGHRGSMFNVSSTLHHNDIPCSKGERLFRGSSKEFRQGEQPQGEFKQGEQPQDENAPLPLMSKGES
jgi:hypothetical protein